MKKLLVNTQEFKRAGLYFLKNGVYTDAPEGTRDYNEFWDEEEKRIKLGYSVGGTKISGRYYFYLNYCPILRVSNKTLNDKDKVSATVDKVAEFPAFWEIDYEWWNAKSEAFNRPFGMGNHLICAKTRGCGFSFKEAADGVYNFHMIPKSKSYYFASKEEFLIKDGILNKVTDYLNHINQHTDFYKNRQIKDTIMHRVAGYKEGVEEKGFMSEIIGTIVDNPNKVRGKRGKKITFEEAGSFKNLKLAYQIAKESVEQGGFVAGQMSVFGTGGEEGEHIEGLEDMFNDPTTYNLLAFDNKWAEGGAIDVLGDYAEIGIPDVFKEQPTNKLSKLDVYDADSTKNVTGFFVPNFMANDKFIDFDGNVDRLASIEFEINARRKLAKSKDPKTIDRKTAERPFIPDEAFSRFHGNILPAHEAREQEKRIKNDTHIQGMIRHGALVYGEEGVKFTPLNVNSLETYPHKNSDNLDGCVTIYEMPYKTNGKIPDNLYMVVVDPYSKDGAEDRTSLGVAYVIKRLSVGGGIGNIISAKYVGRPETLTTFYEQIFKLSRYYNAQIQSEIGGGGQPIIDEARRKKIMHLLEYEPEMLHNKELASNQRNRSYFMNMTKERREIGLLYFRDWLMEERGLDGKGNVILNIHKIYDIGLLQEIAKFRSDKNADRISAMIIAMYMIKEKHAIALNTVQQSSGFFNRPLFGGSSAIKNFDGQTFWLE